MNYPSIFNYLPPDDLNRLMEKYGGRGIRKSAGDVLEFKPPWMAGEKIEVPPGHAIGKLTDIPSSPVNPKRIEALLGKKSPTKMEAVRRAVVKAFADLSKKKPGAPELTMALLGAGMGAYRGSLTTSSERKRALKGGPISRSFGKHPVAFSAATGAAMAPVIWSLTELPFKKFIPAAAGAMILPAVGLHYLDKALLEREQEKQKTAAAEEDKMHPFLRGAGAVGAGVVGAGLGSLAGIGMLEGAKNVGLIPPRAGAALKHPAVRWGIPLLGTGMGLAYNLYKHYEIEELKRALESHKDRTLGRNTGR
jgi:hypothetical protein